MHLSKKALLLLQENLFSRYKRLAFYDCLDEHSRSEVGRWLFSLGALDTSPQILEDYITNELIQEACLISSGHVLSRTTVERWLQNKPTGDLTCPLTRVPLMRRFGPNKKPYILLPSIDQLIACYQLLNQYAKQKNAAASLDDMSLQSIAIQMTSIAQVTLSVGKGTIEMMIHFDDDIRDKQELLTFFVELLFSHSAVSIEEDAYPYHSSFVHYWCPVSSHEFALKTCFPTVDSMETVRRTFSDFHLNELVKIFSEILNLPTAHLDLPLEKNFSLSTIQKDHRADMMTEVDSTLPQLFELVRRVVVFTHRVADQLHYQTLTEVKKEMPASSTFLLTAGFYSSVQKQTDPTPCLAHENTL